MKTAEEFLKQNYTVTYRHLANGDGNNIKAFAIYEAMEEYANQSKWISVEDRLPENYTSVLVGGMNIRCTALYQNNLFTPDFTAIRHEDITHWQPLPTAP